ncbi:hypothetical protein K7432_001092 [Basidiobolus ranarum]|uniref:Uncharacterized protein n=1 Tax=Basidiobolus ranarum TaxID=34480 RepID=A0ABR2X3N4_9FUNG
MSEDEKLLILQRYHAFEAVVDGPPENGALKYNFIKDIPITHTLKEPLSGGIDYVFDYKNNEMVWVYNSYHDVNVCRIAKYLQVVAQEETTLGVTQGSFYPCVMICQNQLNVGLVKTSPTWESWIARKLPSGWAKAKINTTDDQECAWSLKLVCPAPNNTGSNPFKYVYNIQPTKFGDLYIDQIHYEYFDQSIKNKDMLWNRVAIKGFDVKYLLATPRFQHLVLYDKLAKEYWLYLFYQAKDWKFRYFRLKMNKEGYILDGTASEHRMLYFDEMEKHYEGFPPSVTIFAGRIWFFWTDRPTNAGFSISCLVPDNAKLPEDKSGWKLNPNTLPQHDPDEKVFCQTVAIKVPSDFFG